MYFHAQRNKLFTLFNLSLNHSVRLFQRKPLNNKIVCSYLFFNKLKKIFRIFFWCVAPENIHSSLTEVIFSKTSPTLEIPVKLHTFLYIFLASRKPPPTNPHRKFQSLVWGGECAYFLELNKIQVIHFSEFFRLKRTFMFLVSYPQEHIRSFFSTSLYKLFFT